MAQSLSEWWDEDADRLNKMADAARKIAVKVPSKKKDRWEDAIEEDRAWCPTGPGGGTDNSCGGSGGASGSPLLSIEKLVEKIASNPDGFTLDPLSAESPPDGIMVSEFQNDTVRSVTIKASEIKTPRGVKRLSEWVSNNADLLVGQADRYVGGWRAGEDFYIDVSTRFPPEKAADALERGRKSGQLAVFNLGTFKETWVHYDRGDDRKPADYDRKFAKARKESQEKQVYDPDAPAIQDEDWAGDLVRHGKTTVRAYNYSSEEDASNEQSNSKIRRQGQADDHRDVPRDAGVLRAGRGVEGGEARPSVVRRRPGDVAAPVEGSARDSRDCGRGPGGIFGPGNKCQLDGEGGPPSDSFGNPLDGYSRSPSSAMGGGGRVNTDKSWQQAEEHVRYSSEQLQSSPPARSLSGVNSVVVMNGKALADSLKETGVTLDQAARVCGNLSPEVNIEIAHGNLKEMVERVIDPSMTTEPQPQITVVSKQPFGGVEDAIATCTTLTRVDDDGLVLSYTLFSVAPEVQKNNPVAIARGMYSGVVKSINEAEKIGVDEVVMYAAGSDKDDKFKGYRIWPRLGFDGVIPRNKITPTYSLRLGFLEPYGSNIPDGILSEKARQEKRDGALTIQSLYETKEGQRWWEENGGSMYMSLRVGDDENVGWQRFKRISDRVSDRDILDVLEIEWRSIREDRVFCATGQGNGIDNSCGARVMSAPDGAGGGIGKSSVGSGKPASVTVESQESLDKAASVLGLNGIDDVVKISGGNVRGAKVDVYAHPNGFTKVSALWPIDKENPEGGGKVFTEVSMASTPEGKVLGFESFGPSGGSISSGADQQKVISIISEKVAESIEAAEEHGFVAVTTFAVGDVNNQYKGYRLWPQFGFDADLPRDLARRIPPEIVLASKGIAIPPPGSTSIPHHIVVKSLASQHRDLTIQELIKTREGKRWWDQHGDDIELKLDLTDKSSLGYKKWSEMKDRLPALRARNETRSFFDSLVEDRAFCPRGEGNGIDNSCSSKDGDAPTDAFGGSVGGFARTGAVKGGKAPVEQIQRSPAIPIANPVNDAVLSPPTLRSPDGKKIESTSVASRDVPGDIYSFGGREYVSTVTVGQHFSEKQAEDRGGIVIDTSRPLTGDNRQYVIDAHVQQVQSAMSRGIEPVFYTPEERQKQIEEYSVIEPKILGGRKADGEMVSPENCEFIFRAVQAVTSSNASPEANMKRTQAVLDKFFNGDGRVATSTAFGVTGQAIIKSLSRLQKIVDRLGIDQSRELFVDKTMRSGDIDEFFRDVKGVPGDKNAWKPSSYLVDQEVPVFSVFGPKFGTFFANNTGQVGHLTADIWATRTFGRVTGELIQQSKPEKARSYSKDVSKLIRSASVDMLHGYDGNQLMESLSQVASTGEMTDMVRGWAGERLRHYARGDYTEKRGTGGKLNKLAKNMVENDVSLMGTPGSGKRRANMIDVYAEVSKQTGIPVAYAQDVLWQDEQDAYAAAGAKTVTGVGELSFYSDVIRKIAGDKEGRFPRAKKERRSVGEDIEGYVDDYERGGVENILWLEAVNNLSDDEFADRVIKMLEKGSKEPLASLESARNTVEDMRAVGLSKVEMPNAGLDGLHVMGFDAEIPSDLVEMLPESLSHAKTLLDLHVSDEGQEWWKENGRDVDVAIDLDGVQGQIFDSFTAGKRWEDIIDEGILDDYGKP
jgi:hypothetical protein